MAATIDAAPRAPSTPVCTLSVVHEGQLVLHASGGCLKERRAFFSEACLTTDGVPTVKPVGMDATMTPLGSHMSCASAPEDGFRYGSVTPYCVPDEEIGLNTAVGTAPPGNRTAVFTAIGDMVVRQIKFGLPMGLVSGDTFSASRAVLHGLCAAASVIALPAAGARLVLTMDQTAAFVSDCWRGRQTHAVQDTYEHRKAFAAAVAAAAQVAQATGVALLHGAQATADAGSEADTILRVPVQHAFAFGLDTAAEADPHVVRPRGWTTLTLDTDLGFVQARGAVPVIAAAVLGYLRATGFETAEWDVGGWCCVSGFLGDICSTGLKMLPWQPTAVLPSQGVCMYREPVNVLGRMVPPGSLESSSVFAPPAAGARSGPLALALQVQVPLPTGVPAGSGPTTWTGTRFAAAPGSRTPPAVPGPWGLIAASSFGHTAAVAAAAVPGTFSSPVTQVAIQPPEAGSGGGDPGLGAAAHQSLTAEEVGAVLGAVVAANGIPLVCAVPGVPLDVLHLVARVPRAVVIRFGGDGAPLGTLVQTVDALVSEPEFEPELEPELEPEADLSDRPRKRGRGEPLETHVSTARLVSACAPWTALLGLLVAASEPVPDMTPDDVWAWRVAAAGLVAGHEDMTEACPPDVVIAMGQLLVASVINTLIKRVGATAPAHVEPRGVLRDGSAAGGSRSTWGTMLAAAFKAAEEAAEAADTDTAVVLDMAKCMLQPENCGVFANPINARQERAMRNFVAAADALEAHKVARVPSSDTDPGSEPGLGPGLTLALDEVVAAINAHSGGITMQGKAGFGAAGVPLTAVLRGGDATPGAVGFSPPCEMQRERIRDIVTVGGRLASQAGVCVELDRNAWTVAGNDTGKCVDEVNDKSSSGAAAVASEECFEVEGATEAQCGAGAKGIVVPVVCLCWVTLVVVPAEVRDPAEVLTQDSDASRALVAALDRVLGVGVDPRNGATFVGVEGVPGSTPALDGWMPWVFQMLVYGLGRALAKGPAGGVGLTPDPAVQDNLRGLPLTLSAALLRGAAAAVPGGPPPTPADLLASLSALMVHEGGLGSGSGSGPGVLDSGLNPAAPGGAIDQFLGKVSRLVAQCSVLGGPTVSVVAADAQAAAEAAREGGARGWAATRSVAALACFRLVFTTMGVVMAMDYRGLIRDSIVVVVKAPCVPALLAVLAYVNCILGADPCVSLPMSSSAMASASAKGVELRNDVLFAQGCELPVDPVWPGKAVTRVIDAVLGSWKGCLRSGAVLPGFATECFQWSFLRDGAHDVVVRAGLQSLDAMVTSVLKARAATASASASRGNDAVFPALGYFKAAASRRRACQAAEYAKRVVQTNHVLADVMTAFAAFSGGTGSLRALCAMVNALMGTDAWFQVGTSGSAEALELPLEDRLPAQDCPDFAVFAEALGRQLEVLFGGVAAAGTTVKQWVAETAVGLVASLAPGPAAGPAGAGAGAGASASPSHDPEQALHGLAAALSKAASESVHLDGQRSVWWIGKGPGAVCVSGPGFVGWPGPVVCMGPREWLPHALLAASCVDETSRAFARVGPGEVASACGTGLEPGSRPRHLVAVGSHNALRVPGAVCDPLPPWAAPCVTVAVHDTSGGAGAGPGAGPLLPRVAVATVAPDWVQRTGPALDPTGGITQARKKALCAAATGNLNRLSGSRFLTGPAANVLASAGPRENPVPTGLVPLAFTGFGPRGGFLHIVSAGVAVSMEVLVGAVRRVFATGDLRAVWDAAGGAMPSSPGTWLSAVAVVSDGHRGWRVAVGAWAGTDTPMRWFMVGVPPMGAPRQLHTFVCQNNQHSLGTVAKVVSRDPAQEITSGSALMLPAGGMHEAQGWVHFATLIREGGVVVITEVVDSAEEGRCRVLMGHEDWATSIVARMNTAWMQSPRSPVTLNANAANMPSCVAWSVYVWPKFECM